MFIRVWRFFSFHRYTVQLNLIPYIFALNRCTFRCKSCNQTSHFHICSCFRSMSVQIQRDCDTWMSHDVLQIFRVHLLLGKSCTECMPQGMWSNLWQWYFVALVVFSEDTIQRRFITTFLHRISSQQAGVAICLTTATVSGSLRRLLFASLKIRF